MTLPELERGRWCVIKQASGEIEVEGFVPTLYDENDDDMLQSLGEGERAIRVRIVVDEPKPKGARSR